MTVITRFAPSPTGILHIGGARTALFNWLFARNQGGKFLLRLEDTDKKRSTAEAVHAILEGLEWLELHWDGEVIKQSERIKRHVTAAEKLLREGKAYKCYCSQEELSAMRQSARKAGKSSFYDGRWRDKDPSEAPRGILPTIRIKAPRNGVTIINDLVQGTVKFDNQQLDDMVLIRGDGTPTYMLSVVVDDHDMGVTHVIRGDDHLNNAARQNHIYLALGWKPPEFAHIPLIHGSDGAKLSKRHGAVGVESYRNEGYLPEALRNYLSRLGWSHGDDELFTTEQAVSWFSLKHVGKGAARFDLNKLKNINSHYIQESSEARLLNLMKPGLTKIRGEKLDQIDLNRLAIALPNLRPRAKLLQELIEFASFIVMKRPLVFEEKARTALNSEAKEMLCDLSIELSDIGKWQYSSIETLMQRFSKSRNIKLGKIAQPLRAALTGKTTSLGIFDVLNILGQEESIMRISDVTKD